MQTIVERRRNARAEIYYIYQLGVVTNRTEQSSHPDSIRLNKLTFGDYDDREVLFPLIEDTFRPESRGLARLAWGLMKGCDPWNCIGITRKEYYDEARSIGQYSCPPLVPVLAESRVLTDWLSGNRKELKRLDAFEAIL